MDDKELEERLARLRGQPTTRKSDPPITVFINREANKTETQQSDELIKRLMAEAAIDKVIKESRLKKQQSTDEELAERLAKLKGTTSLSSDMKFPDTDMKLDFDEEKELLVERLIAEAKLPQVPKITKAGNNSKDFGTSDSDNDEEELPWCTICNEDASIRCYGCENDLYCQKCFKDFHKDPDLRKHKSVAFTKTKKQGGGRGDDDEDDD